MIEPLDADDDYLPRYVAFLDILGFKALVQEAENTPEIRRGIKDVIETLNRTLVRIEDIDFRFTQFSDCIVISARPTLYGLYAMFNGSRMLFENLIQKGVLLRGGIAMGNLVHQRDVLFGTALIEAYQLDSSGAPPRIALHNSIVEEVARFGKDFGFEDEIAADPHDGSPMLHTLRNFEIYGPPFEPGLVDLVMTAKWIGCHIHTTAKEVSLSDRVRQKWVWMESYWDRSVSTRGILPIASKARMRG